ncbi:alpha/beta hydrolase family protein [Streptomyces sp. NPDC087851]|uniref:alpha/beta hydrolase family protein n=1 Tax=Streptomyces sp. NPDC087851 TaxID=3365810 RepID=UPI00382FF230
MSTRRRTHARALVSGLIALGVTAPLAAPATAAPATAAPPHGRPAGAGAVLAVEEEATLSAATVAETLEKAGIDSSRVRYDVTWYRVLYRTTDSDGAPVVASQLVVLPGNQVRTLPVVSWLHGTTVYKGDVASVNPNSSDRRAALFFASTGRAVSAPDYVGLGRGEGIHPYGDPGATVSASVDALRAARSLAHRKGRELDREVRISGFSQGGPAAMMVGRALQREGADRYFRPSALATVGGPFHLSAFEAAAADDEIANSGLYLAYFVTAWNRLYGLYASPSEAFRAPFDQKVERLFDGDHTGADIQRELPAASKDLFTAEFLDRIRRPGGVLKDRLRALDTTCDWRPGVPVQIFHSKGDKDVGFGNAEHCGDQLTRNHADHRLTDLGDHDHNSSVKQALPRIADFFDQHGDEHEGKHGTAGPVAASAP